MRVIRKFIVVHAYVSDSLILVLSDSLFLILSDSLFLVLSDLHLSDMLAVVPLVSITIPENVIRITFPALTAASICQY